MTKLPHLRWRGHLWIVDVRLKQFRRVTKGPGIIFRDFDSSEGDKMLAAALRRKIAKPNEVF